MSTGYLHASTCYATPALAAKSLCSSLAVIQSDGSFNRCTEVLPTFTGADPAYGTLILIRTAVSGATTSTQQSFAVPQCEILDAAYWSPAIAAWSTALVAVVAAKFIYRKVFDRETL